MPARGSTVSLALFSACLAPSLTFRLLGNRPEWPTTRSGFNGQGFLPPQPASDARSGTDGRQRPISE